MLLAADVGVADASDDLVQMVLSARDIATDELLANRNGATDVLIDDTEAVHYEAQVGDIFKLEVGVADLRGDSASGVFQVINDVLVSQAGVIEPALTQVQDLTFDLRLLDATTGSIDISFAGNEANGRSVPISYFFSGSSDEQRAANFAELLVGISGDLSGIDDVEVTASRNNGGGPNDAGFFTYSVRYIGAEFVNRNDLPALEVDFSIADEALPRTFTDEQDLIAEIFHPRNPDNSFNQTAFVRSIENISRNSNGFGVPLELYASRRIFGTVDGVSTVPVAGETDQILLFDDFGGLGPFTNLASFLVPFGGFLDSFAYDALSIPVIAVGAATDFRVGLDGDVGGDGVLIYGTAPGDESVPENQVRLTESSFFLLDVLPTDPPPRASEPTRVAIPAAAGTIRVYRDGDDVVVEDIQGDTVILRQKLSEVEELELIGRDNVDDVVQIDHERGGVIALGGEAPSITVLAGTGDDTLRLKLDGQDVALDAIGLATEALGVHSESLPRTIIRDAEQVSVEDANEVAINDSQFDLGDLRLILEAALPVQLGASTRMDGGLLRSETPLVLGAGEMLFLNGVIRAPLIAMAGSTVELTGNATVRNSNDDLLTDLSGIVIDNGFSLKLRS
ncbi:MAG: hypothetical protein AAGC97_20365 [Planctomycetota bacterium]